MKHKALDEALLKLNEEVNRFVCNQDRVAEIKALKEENEKLRILRNVENKTYEQCKKTREGWQEMYREKDKDYDELWEKYMKLLRSK